MTSTRTHAVSQTTSAAMEFDRILDLHCDQCRSARSRLLPAEIFCERVHRLVAPRFVTTVVVASALMALLSWGL